MAATIHAHGRLLAGEVGELAGVSGTAVGQWARWGYIRASISTGDPYVYGVEDALEAAIVGDGYGDWPLSAAPLGTTRAGDRTCVVLREPGGPWVLHPRGWQLSATPREVDEVRVRLNRRR